MLVIPAFHQGQRVLVTRLGEGTAGALSAALLALFARARSERAAVCLLAPAGFSTDAPWSAIGAADVPRVEARGLQGAFWRARWNVAAAVSRAAATRATASAAFHLELHKELRRHAGDERLPYPLRSTLREWAQRAVARAAEGDLSEPQATYTRLALRRSVRTSLRPDVAAHVASQLSTLGLDDANLVTVDRAVSASAADALGVLVAKGYRLSRVGTGPAVALPHPAVVDVPASHPGSLIHVGVLLASRFCIAASPDTQRLAYLTNTPCLAIDTTDPIEQYPVRGDGLYLMATPVSLESGHVLPLTAALADAVLRRRERIGWRPAPAPDVAAAVREMENGVARGWTETAAQGQWRTRLEAVLHAGGRPIASGVAGPPPFVGDGRLAQVQAERLQ